MGKGRQEGALVTTCIFPILAAVFVAGRVASRQVGRTYGWDDWLILLSLLLLLGQTITIYQYIVISHTGYWSWEVPKQSIEQQVYAAKWSFAVQMFYHPLMGAIRASIIMFLFRIKDQRWHIRWSLHIVFWINIGYLASTTIVNIFQCNPVRYAYLRPKMDHFDANGHKIPGGKCINSLEFIMSSCALSIFMDLIIIPIPTAMVWNLQMQRKTKMAVVAIMSMGWLATIASVVRLVVYYYRYKPTTDRTHNIGLVTSVVEPSIAILAACAPAMKGLLTLLLPRYFSEDNNNNTGSSHNAGDTSLSNRATYGGTRHKRSQSYARNVDKELEEGIEAFVRRASVGEAGEGLGLKNMESRETGGEERDEGTERSHSMSVSGRTAGSEWQGKGVAAEPFDVLSSRR